MVATFDGNKDGVAARGRLDRGVVSRSAEWGREGRRRGGGFRLCGWRVSLD